MTKGDETRAAILDAALSQASAAGFQSLTIGALAERTGMSKSGLFAHFGSREDLQIAAVEAAAARFTETVFMPALKAKRGLPRLRALFANWLDYPVRSGLTYGCPLQSAAIEFDDRPGAVRDVVVGYYERLERELARAVALAVEQGHMRGELDVRQFVFEVMGIVLAYQHHLRLMRRPDAQDHARAAFERLIAAGAA
jgi:AcrR family transcriptional regulator